MDKIDSELMSIKNILRTDYQYKIPEFQRDFVWKKENIYDMFNDFKEDTFNYKTNIENSPGYLLGNILVFKEKREKNIFVIVDGQQRLTVLTLIFKALHDKLEEIGNNNNDNEPKNRANFLHDFYGYKTESGYIPRIIHDRLLQRYGEVYNIILNFNEDDNKEIKNKLNNLKITESGKNLIESWEAINKELDSLYYLDNSNYVDTLLDLSHYLYTQVKIIRTISPSRFNAFHLFEVLNARGTPLDSIDLIKNRFLNELYNNKKIDSQGIDKFNQHWKSFIVNVQKTKRSRNMDPIHTFFRYFLIMKYGKDIKKSDFFNFFKTGKGASIQGTEIIDFAQDLDDYSEIYYNIMESPLSIFTNDSNEMFVLRKILDNGTQIIPLLMIAYDNNLSDGSKSRIIRLCVRMVVATQYSYAGGNSLLPKVCDAISKYLNSNSNEAIDNMIYSAQNYISNLNNSLYNYLSTESLKNNKASKLLKVIEILFNKSQSINIAGETQTGYAPQLEHIMPQSYANNFKLNTNLGFENKDEMIEGLNNIGNLTLLTSDENKMAYDKPLDSNKKDQDKNSLKERAHKNNESLKENVYKDSIMYITKSFAGTLGSKTESGQTNEHIAKIVNYEKNYETYISDTDNIWTKDSIKNRSEDIAKLVQHFVSDEHFLS